ncbi:hypothetical protein Pla123a_24250 [Posidoniimonas polymericola]|uniref:Conserved hypothetical protein CHP03032 domain-containing protein n=1 Tax=Posidoniimonas polymericola TaxID=2528002 RepID=A0A5C5YQ84_9BACT|nr:TIGR03032 family protein [Posidoniimonas polymericola]TWT76999.1 hypothetical protein Pla123a_24250 [Posidoniimonas polymericola]
MADPSPTTAPNAEPAELREVRYEHSLSLPELLERLQVSLIVSTYQAGKLIALGSHGGQLTKSFHNFDRPMGVALSGDGDSLAVAARDKVWLLRNDRTVARQLPPAGGVGSCFLTRSASVTGEIQAHEMGWAGDELWVVNTLFSCLVTLDPSYSFVPRWRPSFITELAAEDRCHLNGMAVVDGRPKYVTAMGETNSAGGWREGKATGGLLIDVESNEVVARGFAMPHSPTWHGGCVWLLDSGRGLVLRCDPKTGQVSQVAKLPGYTRGMVIHGDHAFVGLSKIRETSTFGGVPIAADRARLKCGFGIVNLRTGELDAQFEFAAGVDEIFDLEVVPNAASVALRGPFAHNDGEKTIWTVPSPGS